MFRIIVVVALALICSSATPAARLMGPGFFYWRSNPAVQNPNA